MGTNKDGPKQDDLNLLRHLPLSHVNFGFKKKDGASASTHERERERERERGRGRERYLSSDCGRVHI